MIFYRFSLAFKRSLVHKLDFWQIKSGFSPLPVFTSIPTHSPWLLSMSENIMVLKTTAVRLFRLNAPCAVALF